VKQKGTDARGPDRLLSPLWRGGGVVFGQNRVDYTINVRRRSKRWRSQALSERLLAGDVVVVDELKLAHKTKDFAGIMATIGAKGNAPTLVVTDQVDRNLKLASRNVPNVQVEPADSVNVYELLRFEKIVCDESRARKLGARLGQGR